MLAKLIIFNSNKTPKPNGLFFCVGVSMAVNDFIFSEVRYDMGQEK
jgi:hypothetical protein